MRKLILLVVVLGMATSASAKLVLWWDFEDSGDTTYDQVGNKDGTLSSGVERGYDASGPYGRIVKFDGTEGEGIVSEEAWLTPPMEGGDFTFSAVCRVNDYTTPVQPMCVMSWDSILHGVHWGKVYGAWVSSNSWNESWWITGYIDSWLNNDWHQFTMTFENGGADPCNPHRRTMYLDGVVIPSNDSGIGQSNQIPTPGFIPQLMDQAEGAGIRFNNDMFKVGGMSYDPPLPWRQYEWDGDVAEVKVYDTALTQAEVLAEYNKFLNPTHVATIDVGDGIAVDEDGPTSDTYSIVMSEPPPADAAGGMKITLEAIDYEGQVTLSPDPNNMIFTTANWDTPQVVTVTAVDDALGEDDHSVMLFHEIIFVDPTVDPNDYLYTNPAFAFPRVEDFGAVTVDIIDNDDYYGIEIVESGGSTDVEEEGATSDTYTMEAKKSPAAPIDVEIIVDVDQISTPSTVTFDNSNWQTPQVVTVTAVDDSIQDPLTHAVPLQHSIPVELPVWNTTYTDNFDDGVPWDTARRFTADPQYDPIETGGKMITYYNAYAVSPVDVNSVYSERVSIKCDMIMSEGIRSCVMGIRGDGTVGSTYGPAGIEIGYDDDLDYVGVVPVPDSRRHLYIAWAGKSLGDEYLLARNPVPIAGYDPNNHVYEFEITDYGDVVDVLMKEVGGTAQSRLIASGVSGLGYGDKFLAGNTHPSYEEEGTMRSLKWDDFTLERPTTQPTADQLNWAAVSIDSVVAKIAENDCSAYAFGFSPMDFNEDCDVTLADFVEFASEWLSCSWPLDPSCTNYNQ